MAGCLVYLKEKFTIKEICAMVPFLLRHEYQFLKRILKWQDSLN